MSSPVVDALREQDINQTIHTLSSGVRVTIGHVSQMEVQTIAGRVEAPPVPIFVDPDTQREIPNENDPAYIAAVQKANMRRGMIVLESALFTVTLVDGLPADDGWVDELRFKEQRKIVDLEGLDLDNRLQREFAFKKYVAFRSNKDWELLQERVQKVTRSAAVADNSFRGDEERSTNSQSPTEEGNNGN